MVTLRTSWSTRWENPDYTGVIAEAPLGHVLFPLKPFEPAASPPYKSSLRRSKKLTLETAPEAGNATSDFGKRLLLALPLKSSVLGSLLPGIWNARRRDSCRLFFLPGFRQANPGRKRRDKPIYSNPSGKGG